MKAVEAAKHTCKIARCVAARGRSMLPAHVKVVGSERYGQQTSSQKKSAESAYIPPSGMFTD